MVTPINSNAPIEEQVRVLIQRLSAYIEQFHGGSVEFISFDGKVLKVHLGGACLGCPLSPNTLRLGGRYGQTILPSNRKGRIRHIGSIGNRTF